MAEVGTCPRAQRVSHGLRGPRCHSPASSAGRAQEGLHRPHRPLAPCSPSEHDPACSGVPSCSSGPSPSGPRGGDEGRRGRPADGRPRPCCGHVAAHRKSRGAQAPPSSVRASKGQGARERRSRRGVTERPTCDPRTLLGCSLPHHGHGRGCVPVPGPAGSGATTLASSGTGHSAPGGPECSLSSASVPRMEEAVRDTGGGASATGGLLAHLGTPGTQASQQHVRLNPRPPLGTLSGASCTSSEQ